MFADYVAGMDTYRKAAAAFAAQRYADAKRFALETIRSDPDNPHAQALLGDLAYLAHDLDGAKIAWTRALTLEPRLRPIQQRLEQLTREQALEAGNAALETATYIIRAPRDATLDTAWLLKQLEEAQMFIEQQLQCTLRGPVTVLLYDPDVFYGYGGLHVPTSVAGLYDGKIRLPAPVGQGQPGPASTPIGPSVRAVIWHELTHAVVQQLTRGRAPRWVHEGVAQAVQEHVEAIPTAALQIALRRKTAPSIAQLEGRDSEMGQTIPMEAGLFYQASWAQMEYLIAHRGWAGLHRLLDALAAGASAAEAIEQVDGVREMEWERQWRRWAQQHFQLPTDAP